MIARHVNRSPYAPQKQAVVLLRFLPAADDLALFQLEDCLFFRSPRGCVFFKLPERRRACELCAFPQQGEMDNILCCGVPISDAIPFMYAVIKIDAELAAYVFSIVAGTVTNRAILPAIDFSEEFPRFARRAHGYVQCIIGI